jgi:hypothetical protein
VINEEKDSVFEARLARRWVEVEFEQIGRSRSRELSFDDRLFGLRVHTTVFCFAQVSVLFNEKSSFERTSDDRRSSTGNTYCKNCQSALWTDEGNGEICSPFLVHTRQAFSPPFGLSHFVLSLLHSSQAVGVGPRAPGATLGSMRFRKFVAEVEEEEGAELCCGTE